MSLSISFGAELRRLRQESGLTLTEFAVVMNYNKGYLSKIERGLRPASAALAQRCDALFRADGRLRRLAAPDSSCGDAAAGNQWSVARRTLLAAGTASLIDSGSSKGGGDPTTSAALAPSLLAQFGHLRVLGQSTAPTVLLPLLETQTRLVAALASTSPSSSQTQMLLLASRFAEYTGWIAQESGDDSAALGWTSEAVTLARVGGDHDLASYALVRRALVALYSSDSTQTIALSRRAQDADPPPRIYGLAAQREAQGHALAGDERACLRSLDRARDSLDSNDARSGAGPVIGTTHLSDPAAMAMGWCLHDLGRPRAAAEVLDRECVRIPSHALRTRTRYGLRRSLAHAAAGEVEQSCTIAGELLGIMTAVPSATVATDIRRLARELSRFRTNRTVRDLQPALAQALSSTHG